MKKLPPLNSLKCFEAVARCESFSRAAAELSITQSAVSHHIRTLEEWFGCSLMERSSKRSAPTVEGRELARSLTEGFAVISQACARLAAPRLPDGLTIGVLPSIGTIWLIPQLQDFYGRHPDIQLKFVYSMHGSMLDFGSADAAIIWRRRQEADAQHTEVLPGDTVAVASQALIERFGPFGSPADMRKAPLLHDSDRRGWQAYFRKAGVDKVSAAPGPIFADFGLLRAAAMAGQGLALCPRAVIENDVIARRLSILFDTITINEDYAYWLAEPRQPKPQLARFKTWLLQIARSSASTA